MTTRRPPGMRFETWVEQQIRESMERGEFDDLEGTGRPIADIDEPNDELRWVRQKLRREGFTFLPASLALRKEAEEARAAAAVARTEAEARSIIEAINVKLLDAVRTPLSGPPVYVPPFDVDRVIEAWRRDHQVDRALEAARAEVPTVDAQLREGDLGEDPPRRRRSWRRRRP